MSASMSALEWRSTSEPRRMYFLFEEIVSLTDCRLLTWMCLAWNVKFLFLLSLLLQREIVCISLLSNLARQMRFVVEYSEVIIHIIYRKHICSRYWLQHRSDWTWTHLLWHVCMLWLCICFDMQYMRFVLSRSQKKKTSPCIHFKFESGTLDAPPETRTRK